MIVVSVETRVVVMIVAAAADSDATTGEVVEASVVMIAEVVEASVGMIVEVVVVSAGMIVEVVVASAVMIVEVAEVRDGLTIAIGVAEVVKGDVVTIGVVSGRKFRRLTDSLPTSCRLRMGSTDWRRRSWQEDAPIPSSICRSS